MDKKRDRGSNFSTSEVDLLMTCVFNEIKIIENKKTNAASVREKQSAWKRVQDAFNCNNTEAYTRDMNSLRIKYDNVKRILKKKISVAACNTNDSGGPLVNMGLKWYEEQLHADLQLRIEGLPAVSDSENFTSPDPSIPNLDWGNGNNIENVDIKFDTVEHQTSSSQTSYDASASIDVENEITKKWNLKQQNINAARSEQRKATLNAFETLAENKQELASIQKKCFQAELNIKLAEEKNLSQEWALKEQVLQADLEIRKEQLNSILEERKRQVFLHNLICEKKKLEIANLKCELDEKRKTLLKSN